MLQFLDIFFTILHLVIIIFNLTGWIWASTRKLHLYCVVVTAASWLLLGIWFGLGYCPITDWQWRVKERLGEENLPNSFIKYFADKVSGGNVSSTLVDNLTALFFFIAVILSIYFNFFRKEKSVVQERS